MKKSLLSIIAMLALSTVMAAFAATSANVSNATMFTVASTDDALLAIDASDKRGNKDGSAVVEDNVLKFNFGKGKEGKNFGLQPNSAYHWDPLYKITNNSEETVEVSLSFQNGDSNKPKNSTWTFNAGVPNDDNAIGGQNFTTLLEYNDGKQTKAGKVTLAPGQFVWVEFDLSVHGDAELDEFNTRLYVNASAVR